MAQSAFREIRTVTELTALPVGSIILVSVAPDPVFPIHVFPYLLSATGDWIGTDFGYRTPRKPEWFESDLPVMLVDVPQTPIHA